MGAQYTDTAVSILRQYNENIKEQKLIQVLSYVCSYVGKHSGMCLVLSMCFSRTDSVGA